jgi:membrane protein implicated in regulation of membrane protease activity
MDTGNALVQMGNHTPLNMVMSFYLLSLGLIGVSFYNTLDNKIIWLVLVIAVPLLITKILSLIWQKIAQNLTYKVEQGMELVGKKGTVRVEVTESGGLVGVSSELYTHEVPVKSLYPLSKFEAGDQVYICDFQEGFYLVDSSPNSIRRIRLRTRGIPTESGEPKEK